ncbi:MAG: hypothetical protein HC851_19640 [Acaryochloris sp. RU_4_1]|nr:hypothetical protein [Acaryochloris sp. RU_4_1]
MLIHILKRFTKEKHKRTIFKQTQSKSRPLQLGRVFRKLGLPPWTLMGIGISAIWFNYLGLLFEELLRNLLHLNPQPKQWLDYLPQIIVLVVPFIFVIFLGLVLKHSHFSNPAVIWGNTLQKPKGKRGLILLVSNVESALYAIQYHLIENNTLETVWLLPSNNIATDTFGSSTEPKAQEIVTKAKEMAETHSRELNIEIHPHGVSPADSQDTFDAVNRIFRFSNYDTQDLIADFTGGTKPMSVGMIMACLKSDRELEYVSFNPIQKQSYGPYIVDYQYSAFDLIG